MPRTGQDPHHGRCVGRNMALGRTLTRLLPAWAVAIPMAALACGERLTLPTHAGTSTQVAYVAPKATPPLTLLLLAGGGGHVALGADGCARQLQGNSLLRAAPLFQAAGLGTAVVDAPSDHQGEDGLGGFRLDEAHAQDIGQVVAELRRRTGGAVWVVGTSRGAISAANAATRLVGDAAPDGVVLTSALMAGQSGQRKAWVAHSVFDLPLQRLTQPLLLLGHADDVCPRSPPALMPRVMAQVRSDRAQVVTLSGGPGSTRGPGLEACEGRSPHGFHGQDGEMAEGIVRFVRGGRF